MFKFKLSIIAVFMMLLVFPVLAVEDNLTIVGGDEVTIREFLHIYMRDMSPPDTETTIYIGQIPEELGITLPELNVKFVGSIVREGPYSNTELIAISQDSVESLDQAFQSQMIDLGWERVGVPYGQRGFVATPQAYADYCQKDAEKFVNINLRGINDETQVRININPADPYMCNQGDMEEAYNNDPYLRLPELATPEGVTVQFNRGGGGGGGGYPGSMFSSTSTWLTSEILAMPELLDAYNAQLVDNGWEMTSSEVGEHMSLSQWTFSHEDTQWVGYFSLMASAIGDGAYYATVMVEQISE